jgi:hypothetical protein
LRLHLHLIIEDSGPEYLKVVITFADLLNEEVLTVCLKGGKDLTSSEALNPDCFPHRTVFEELPWLKSLDMSLNSVVDTFLSDFFSMLGIEFFISLDEGLEEITIDETFNEEMPDCGLIVHD